ncbi:MAG TPA: hypothetical protein VJ885_09235 [Thermoanaerobaculia bacterium]|nr:hypothetical protein [Thermoanaerobaculia bacterium]
MTKPLRTEEEAVQEIEDATHWYERQRPGLGTEFPYHLVYLEMEEEIRVLAFAHDRRRPGYWLSRSELD